MTPEMEKTLQRVSQGHSSYDDAVWLLSQLRLVSWMSWVNGALFAALTTGGVCWLLWGPL